MNYSHLLYRFAPKQGCMFLRQLQSGSRFGFHYQTTCLYSKCSWIKTCNTHLANTLENRKSSNRVITWSRNAQSERNFSAISVFTYKEFEFLKNPFIVIFISLSKCWSLPQLSKNVDFPSLEFFNPKLYWTFAAGRTKQHYQQYPMNHAASLFCNR